jgi:hypothetical protein
MEEIEEMEEFVEAQIGEWIYRDGSNFRGVQIWDEEEHHYMEMFYSKTKASWICKGFLDECITSKTTCKHALVLNNLSKNTGIDSKSKLVRSKCSFCEEVIFEKEDYKAIKAACASFYDKDKIANQIYSEEFDDIVILKCGHFGHKACYDGKCPKCPKCPKCHKCNANSANSIF